ncbi:MAG: HesA/MoeB/ThiF family protein [Ferruginibacter sp.]
MHKRYNRQLILKEFGAAGQQKLLEAKVLVIGAGGLGCPALQYLTAAGVGTIGLVDNDVVSVSNLHRQVLYSTADVGQSKVLTAKERLSLLNPDASIVTYNERINNLNALDIIEGYDIVIDGTDNFASRYLINDACVILDKALIYGAVSQFEGQVAIFNCRTDEAETAINYRDIFPEQPEEGTVLNCAEAGVLGVLPGVIGTMQANEAIKLITGIGNPLINSMLTFNALTNYVYKVELTANESSRALIPADAAAFRKTNYDWQCKVEANGLEIDSDIFNRFINSSNTSIIDIREYNEVPLVNEFPCVRSPLPELRKKIDSIHSENIILFCQTGKRSLQAAQLLQDTFGTSKKVYSLKGGIIEWLYEHQ